MINATAGLMTEKGMAMQVRATFCLDEHGLRYSPANTFEVAVVAFFCAHFTGRSSVEAATLLCIPSGSNISGDSIF